MKPTITSTVDYVPTELIEKILLNLPVKSLLRFSTASKLWNSIIFHPKFKKSYRGREMIVFNSSRRKDSDSYYSVCRLSSLSSDNPTDGTTTFVSPFPYDPCFVFLASCGNLWCQQFENSLVLYNPSIHTYRKLPDSDFEPNWPIPSFGYGLGYDCVCDDYKILKIIHKRKYPERTKSEIYSLRNDCWRKVESQPPPFNGFWWSTKEGLFVSGAFHWLVARLLPAGNFEEKYILSFDLSEEKFGLIELPEKPYLEFVLVDFGGKLRVYVNHNYYDKYYGSDNFTVWVMENYGSKFWTKEMEIESGHMPRTALTPFYFYDGAANLVRAVVTHDQKMFIYKEEDGSSSNSTLVERDFSVNGFNVAHSLTYVESLALIPFNSAWEL